MSTHQTESFSGKDGTVKFRQAVDTSSGVGFEDVELFEVLNWTFKPRSKNPQYSSNRTAGYMKRDRGIEDGDGSIKVVVPAGSTPPFVPNNFVDLVLIDGHATTFLVPAVITSMPYECDIDNGETVGYSYDYSCDGEWATEAAE